MKLFLRQLIFKNVKLLLLAPVIFVCSSKLNANTKKPVNANAGANRNSLCIGCNGSLYNNCIVNPDLSASAQSPAYPAIFINLLQKDSVTLLDGVATGFANKFSALVDDDDAEKQYGFNENIALVRDGKTLAVEMRPVPKTADSLFFRLSGIKQQPYVIKVFTANVPENVTAHAWLVDKYMNTRIKIKLRDTTVYRFTAGADTNSYVNRFMIIYDPEHTAQSLLNAGNVITQNSLSTTGSISIYPNPVHTNQAALYVKNMEKGSYEAGVYDSKGQQLVSIKMQYDGNNNIYTLPLNKVSNPGLYIVHIVNQNSKKYINLNLIISK